MMSAHIIVEFFFCFGWIFGHEWLEDAKILGYSHPIPYFQG